VFDDEKKRGEKERMTDKERVSLFKKARVRK